MLGVCLASVLPPAGRNNSYSLQSANMQNTGGDPPAPQHFLLPAARIFWMESSMALVSVLLICAVVPGSLESPSALLDDGSGAVLRAAVLEGFREDVMLEQGARCLTARVGAVQPCCAARFPEPTFHQQCLFSLQFEQSLRAQLFACWVCSMRGGGSVPDPLPW